MGYFTENNYYHEQVEKYETTDQVLGGPEDAPDNLPLKRLVDRSNFLKKAIDALKTSYDSFVQSVNSTLSSLSSTLANKANASDVYTKSQTDSQISTAVNALINGAPGSLDALNELAAAMGNDPNFAGSVINSIANEATARANADALKANASDVYTKSQTDAAISSAVQPTGKPFTRDPNGVDVPRSAFFPVMQENTVDLSSVIPAGTKMVLVKLAGTESATQLYVQKPGETFSYSKIMLNNPGMPFGWVGVNSSRQLKVTGITIPEAFEGIAIIAYM